jgi:hypothetical protein
MTKECITSIWYNEPTDKFYVNIWEHIGITTAKEKDKICVKCSKLLEWCKKSDVLYKFLSNNED